MSDQLSHDLEAASRFVGERGIAGFVWADEKFIARQRIGRIVDFVPLGVPITDSVLPLLGFDEKLRELQRRPSHSVAIPHILIDPTDRQSPRINIAVYWRPEEKRYLMLVTRAVPRHDLEIDLAAQVRKRAIAEADATAKARQIARVNDELTRINRELEEFASVISHDLRSPLRRLRYFATDAERAVSEGEADTVQTNLQRVSEQAKRMGSMLSGLLEYSRIGRKLEAIETVDTRALVEEVIGSVERAPALMIDMVGSWPVLDTVVQPLDIVLRNLIDNAVKHHDRGNGRITVKSEDGGACWICSVMDDGPGIPSEWHEAIFEPFKRIGDPDDAPEGSGIGLSLVKKTIEWVGGRIEVHSAPDRSRGTTFQVHWPKVINV